MRKGALVLSGGGEIFVDRVVTLRLLEGPRLQGLPHDRHGFIPVDAHGRVAGVADIYAAGDITVFPLKQGGLAAQQADAVAGVIAAAAGAAVTPEPFSPVLRGLLMTGGAPLYLRCEPQRLAREATVAMEATRARGDGGGGSAAAGQALWWPPAQGRGALPGKTSPPRVSRRAPASCWLIGVPSPGRASATRNTKTHWSWRCCWLTATRAGVTTAPRSTRSTRPRRCRCSCLRGTRPSGVNGARLRGPADETA